jgi:hypothetical protein
MCGDAPRPSLKAMRGLEAGVSPVNAPECFHCQVLRRCRISDNAQNPAVNRTLVQAEECLEGGHAASPKLIQDIARFVLHPSFPSYQCLRVWKKKGYIL